MQAYLLFPGKPLLRITSSSISSHRLTSHHHLITHPCFFVLSACACCPEDTVTSSSPTPFVSPRSIFDKTYPSVTPSPSHHRIIKRAREWPCAPPSMRLPLPAGKLLSGMTAMVFGLDLHVYSCASCSRVAVTWISSMRRCPHSLMPGPGLIWMHQDRMARR